MCSELELCCVSRIDSRHPPFCIAVSVFDGQFCMFDKYTHRCLKVTGDAKKEAVAINKSLTCLGDVIFARVSRDRLVLGCMKESKCKISVPKKWNFCFTKKMLVPKY